MTVQQLVEVLSGSGLHHESVEELIEQYEQMESCLERGEYSQVTDHVEAFCQAYVHLLHIESGEPLERDPNVAEFVEKALAKEIGSEASASVQGSIPQMLNAAVETDRAPTGARGLEESINHSDARVGVGISSWLLVELVRLYTVSDEFEESVELEGLISELSSPPEEEPLADLVRSRYEFDEQRLARELDGVVHIVQEDKQVVKGSNFPSTKDKEITALLLGQLAAYKQGYYEMLGVDKSWVSDRARSSIVTQNIESLAFVFKDDEEGGYYIPGYRVDEALNKLTAAE